MKKPNKAQMIAALKGKINTKEGTPADDTEDAKIEALKKKAKKNA